jgi:hypothetical protein
MEKVFLSGWASLKNGSIAFLNMLAPKLDLEPDADLIDEINLDDPRLADLVHTVTIV